MSLQEVKKRLEILSAERIRQTDEQLEKLRQQKPSATIDLMIQSLEYRKEKLSRQ